VTEQQPLRLRDRSSIHLSPVEELGRLPSGSNRIALLDWQAKLAGDLDALGILSSLQLRMRVLPKSGISAERLILQLALARAERIQITKIGDLRQWCEAIREGLVLAKLESYDFGSREPESLEKSFRAATERVNTLDKLLARDMTQLGDWASLVRILSFCGDLFLSDAVCTCLLSSGDQGWGQVVFAASLRHLHQSPEQAVKLSSDVLTLVNNPGAMTNLAASHGDLGRRTGDLKHFRTAREIALVAVAFAQNIYAFRTGARAFKNSNDHALRDLCREAWRQHDLGFVPEPFGSWKKYDAHMSLLVLTAAGRRDLAEVPLRNLWVPELWARDARQLADASA
jgi:hypothetical protein